MQNWIYILLILVIVYFITSKIKEGLEDTQAQAVVNTSVEESAAEKPPTTLNDIAALLAADQGNTPADNPCDRVSTTDEIKNMNAKELCERVSSRAEEIAAEYDGATALTGAAWGPFGFLNPQNYKAGDNTSSNMARNIVNMNMSSSDMQKISASCNNLTTSTQLNEIDTTQCEYCQKYGCDISNVTQENLANSKQTCAIQVAIETLLKKTDSIDAMALGKSLQDASGLLSGDNTSVSENCNIINKDMSSCSYLDLKMKCLNAVNMDQTNRYKNCGDAQNIIQKNVMENVQSCVMGSDIKSDTTFVSNTQVGARTETDQSSTGIDAMASFMSVLSSCVSVCSLVVIGYFAQQMNQDQGGGGGYGGYGRYR
jgi:hypothetical protein